MKKLSGQSNKDSIEKTQQCSSRDFCIIYSVNTNISKGVHLLCNVREQYSPPGFLSCSARCKPTFPIPDTTMLKGNYH